MTIERCFSLLLFSKHDKTKKNAYVSTLIDILRHFNNINSLTNQIYNNFTYDIEVTEHFTFF